MDLTNIFFFRSPTKKLDYRYICTAVNVKFIL